MKAFQFNGTEYKDLNTLGIAFAEQFPQALQAIKEKAFLKFVKKFKNYKKKVKQILYESRYLQNALSMMIYLFTEEHILIVGNRSYKTVLDCFKDLKRNQAFLYFAEDHGFTNTIVQDLQDEKLKKDIQTFEDNSRSKLGLEYLHTYYKKDSLSYGTVLKQVKAEASSDNDEFKTLYKVFQNQELLIALAHKTSLAEMLEITKSNCPVFKGILASGDEIAQPLTILENAFFTSLLDNYKEYKYKKVVAKNLKRKLKRHKKSLKKLSKLSFEQKIKWYEYLYTCYLEMVDLYRIDKVKASNSELEFTISYCNTYISPMLLNKYALHEDLEHDHISVLKTEYSLKAFSKSLKTHRSFAVWSILLSIFVGLAYFVVLFFDFLLELFLGIFAMIGGESYEKTSTEMKVFSTTTLILFVVGLCIALGMATLILIMRSFSKRKYKCLGKLAYYRNHESILVEKEQKEYETLKDKEEKYAKRIDRFYRFYGGVGIFGLSLATIILCMCVAYIFGESLLKGVGPKIEAGLQDKIYFLFIPPVVLMLLGFARHKKTAWSILLGFFLSIVLGIGLVLLFYKG